MTRADLRQIIVDEIGAIAPEADLASVDDGEDLREAIDLDSMDIFNLVVALSRRLGFDIPDADAGQLVTLGGAIEYLGQRLEAR
ncbi:acyl carrier protein [Qipengyuania zhejiangensis]|uniref:acyl carrier protein n=1 Tax=Qipengyuania zhejiangensis TaxID=3077782 RepID=UPI002D77CD25|nr:phosphopantetheine-binding protein [Qipengyuania sp. Z2]